MPFTFRPAKRENTPLIVGLAGPTKSGKTYSAHRLARGLVSEKSNPRIIMLNAEGQRGHQYADEFQYIACDIEPPYGPDRYAEAIDAIKKEGPDCVIVDSCSHMHDGPGGLIEWHEKELDAMAGNDRGRRLKCTWAAWIKPKAAENAFIYSLLGLDCPVILCFRAKEKLKIIPGKDPIDLGWQPIAGERITFETIFTLVLPPHSKGVPDLQASEMRKPFDKLVPEKQPINEELGRVLANWSKGGSGSVNQNPGVPIARREDVPAGSEPQCKECSAAKGDEVQRVFIPASAQSAAVWACPNAATTKHPNVSHARVLEKLRGA